jgi:hypothetical protein
MTITPSPRGLFPRSIQTSHHVIYSGIMVWVIEPWMALVVQVVVLNLNRYVLFRVDSWS